MPNTIKHSGVKGQKWGVRNYQNADGSYTTQAQNENGGLGRYAPKTSTGTGSKKGVTKDSVKAAKKELKSLKRKQFVRDNLLWGRAARLTKKGRQLRKDIKSAKKAYKEEKKKLKQQKKVNKIKEASKLSHSKLQGAHIEHGKQIVSKKLERSLIENKELKHSGIKGQKWGDRRYQNEDGTYTEEGKARRRKSDSYSQDYKRHLELKKLNRKQMSNKDLNDYNNRVNLESNYRRSRVNDNPIGRAAKTVAAVGGIIAAGTAFYNAAKNGKEIVDKLLKKNG